MGVTQRGYCETVIMQIRREEERKSEKERRKSLSPGTTYSTPECLFFVGRTFILCNTCAKYGPKCFYIYIYKERM